MTQEVATERQMKSRQEDHLPLPNCDSDGKAKNKRQRTVVIYHQSECEEEVISINFPCALENVSCHRASVDLPERVSRYTAFTQYHTTPGRPGNEVVPRIA